MLRRSLSPHSLVARAAVASLCLLILLQPALVLAGHFGFRGSQVGGISIDAEGVLRNAKPESKAMLRQALLKEVQKPGAELNQPVGLRMVSLKGLEAAIREARKDNLGQLPDEIRFLSGIQRIQYVLVFPEQNDVVLAGPGEGWKVDENAVVVGVTTGLPVIQLDDFLVAMRSVNAARQQGISCSIDPTPEGRQNLERYFQANRQPSPTMVQDIQKVMGPQQITLTGVPADSHFARVLVAADYHMKRIGMNLDKSPVAAIPGYLDMLAKKGGKPSSATPRWWLACNYEPLLKSEDGLSWELRGTGVKAMTEDDIVSKEGQVAGAGRKGDLAQQWADLMTQHYGELSKKNAVFGELRNIMDMCVIAALIEKEGLATKAGLSIPLLTEASSELTTLAWYHVPKTVATQCSFIKAGREYIVTASGGVQVDSWGVVANSKVQAEVAQVREKAGAPTGKAWWYQAQ